jgi:hypothetical protein
MQGRTEAALTGRCEALLRVSQTLISIRSSEELFRLLARELRAVVNCFNYRTAKRRPMPVPWGLVVKNGSKTLLARSGGNPLPVSLTEISTRSSGFRCDLIVRCAEPPLKPSVNQIVKDQQFLRLLHIKTAVRSRQPDQNTSSS